MSEVFLLLGSNLGNRLEILNLAIDQVIAKTGAIKRRSGIYETEPWGTEDPQPFLNIIISITTELEPITLLETLLSIEADLGRKRDGSRNRPRSIDIDILLYNNLVLKSMTLTIPHERMHLRKFVLVPLAEIAPSLVHPVLHKNISQLLSECEDNSWVRKFKV